jgi:hypothetical protein
VTFRGIPDISFYLPERPVTIMFYLIPDPSISAALSTLIRSQQFYYDPVLYNCILQLEEQVQQLSGHVKMMAVELQNEKRQNN